MVDLFGGETAQCRNSTSKADVVSARLGATSKAGINQCVIIRGEVGADIPGYAIILDRWQRTIDLDSGRDSNRRNEARGQDI